MHGISDMRYMHRGYAYVKYRQMFSICIDAAYADGEDMRMPRICRYQACGYAKNMQFYCFFQLRSENLQSRISANPTGAQRPGNTRCSGVPS